MKNITKIVLTGGPCSGKTTICEYIEKYYQSKNYKIIICSESATQIKINSDNKNDIFNFQISVAQNQIANENKINELLNKIEDDNIIIIYDRGLTDCFAYLNDDEQEILSDIIGCNLVNSWFRYDAVLFLETATKQNYIMNNIRNESFEVATNLSKSTLNCWIGHPHFRFVKSTNKLIDKQQNVVDEIDAIINNIEIEKKLLIEYPNINELSKYPIAFSKIEQTYLLSDFGSHRIRKRTFNDVIVYYETLKIRINNHKCNEIENKISKHEYEKLMQMADPNKNTIKKIRYCFLYKGQYFELDIYDFFSDKATIELELKNENQNYTLPKEIKVIKDVSDDKKYKNNYLAGLKL